MKLFTGLILAALATSCNANANTTVYSAHRCDAPNKVYRTDGSVANPNPSTTLSYWCDVPNTGAVYNVAIRVYDANPSKSLSCSLYTYAADGSSSVLQNQSTTTTAVGGYTLTFTNVVNYADASYSIACVLPESYSGQESKIFNYKIGN
ncbi:hypothetical protein [Rheinheimera texasensis]|uniref:hypothetical protein n=1 Tax=Rheinheimera texasensis TaxID=306205 RepID=UPI0032B2E323